MSFASLTETTIKILTINYIQLPEQLVLNNVTKISEYYLSLIVTDVANN